MQEFNNLLLGMRVPILHKIKRVPSKIMSNMTLLMKPLKKSYPSLRRTKFKRRNLINMLLGMRVPTLHKIKRVPSR